jgi:hypothetical protein
METEKILTSLCYYDKRNPDCSVDEETIEDHNKMLLKKGKTCSCDNCFYGRTELAKEILELLTFKQLYLK